MTTLLRAVIEATGLSRRKAFSAIREGRVRIDGVPHLEPSMERPPGSLDIDGEAFALPEKRRPIYLLLNKPAGYVTTTSDERGRPTVIDLVPVEYRAAGLHPVGRLDLDTSGLLVLTNDGDLTYRLTHPSNEVDKEYWVGLYRLPDADLLNRVWMGVEIDGEVRQPLEMERLDGHAPYHVTITIGEGRKRQVRRMFEIAGARVRHLKRMREGTLSLGSLPEGQTRQLTAGEVRRLRGGGG